MSKYDWVLLAGIVALAGVAFWYQIRYYKLVDDLFEFLTAEPTSKEESE